MPGSAVAVATSSVSVSAYSSIPTLVTSGAPASVGQTKIQKATLSTVVSATAKQVTPQSGPTMTRPSQRKVCRPPQVCQPLRLGCEAMDAVTGSLCMQCPAAAAVAAAGKDV